MPDPLLLGCTLLEDPPRDSAVRLDFVRLAMHAFCARRGFARLGRVFLRGSEDELQTLFNACKLVTGELDEATYNEDGRYNRALALLASSGARYNAELLRLASIAEGVIDWGMTGEFEDYVVPNWRLLCEEVEFEQTMVLHGTWRGVECWVAPEELNVYYGDRPRHTRAELMAMHREEKRHERSEGVDLRYNRITARKRKTWKQAVQSNPGYADWTFGRAGVRDVNKDPSKRVSQALKGCAGS